MKSLKNCPWELVSFMKSTFDEYFRLIAPMNEISCSITAVQLSVAEDKTAKAQANNIYWQARKQMKQRLYDFLLSFDDFGPYRDVLSCTEAIVLYLSDCGADNKTLSSILTSSQAVRTHLSKAKKKMKHLKTGDESVCPLPPKIAHLPPSET